MIEQDASNAVRAQNDARFAEVLSRLDRMPSSGFMIGTAASTVLGIVGIILAILAFGGDRFSGGVQLSSVSVQQAEDAKRVAGENTKAIEEVSGKLDSLLKMLSAPDQ